MVCDSIDPPSTKMYPQIRLRINIRFSNIKGRDDKQLEKNLYVMNYHWCDPHSKNNSSQLSNLLVDFML